MKNALLVALSFFSFATIFAQVTSERLEINWPVKERWKLLADNKDSMSRILEYAPQEATLTKWDTIIYVQTIKNIVAPSLDLVMSSYSKAALKESSKAIFTVIDKDESTKNFWVIYKVETADFPNDPVPESQLWYIVQGNETLFVNFIAVKEKTISDAFVAYWSNVFKSSKLIQAPK